MTVDEHIARVMRTIDAAFRAQLDRNVDRMIESGVPEDRVMDHADEQRDVYAAWRVQALADMRKAMLDSSGWAPTGESCESPT